jgi:hypothetical protein
MGGECQGKTKRKTVGLSCLKGDRGVVLSLFSCMVFIDQNLICKVYVIPDD